MKILLTLFLILDFGYHLLFTVLNNKQRKKPLPKEVSDVYDENRYQTFINYKSDYRKLSLVTKVCTMLLDLVLIYSNFFSFLESFTKNPYLLVLISSIILLIINSIFSYIIDYYRTFTIEEKYGMNKKDLKEFNKDFFINLILELSLSVCVYLFITFVCESIGSYSQTHSITYLQSLGICLLIIGAFALIIVFFMFMSYLSLKKQYEFSELENGPLRVKIEDMMKDCKKKVQKIQVYNESKKSTSKNAFLLKLLWIREFGIADNFMNENCEDELLAVLAHEIGHLKHKKDIYDYSKYVLLGIVLILFVWLLPHIELIKDLNSMILTSFNLTTNNYYVSFLVVSILLNPLSIIFEAYSNTITRIQEYEADDHSVKMGYGKELIHTFKQLSNDELVDVNPHPFVEFMTYNHPGMYNRIKHIQEKMESN